VTGTGVITRVEKISSARKQPKASGLSQGYCTNSKRRGAFCGKNPLSSKIFPACQKRKNGLI